MLLAVVVLLALISSHLLLLWKGLQERTARWKLYALRDKLRFAAINDETILNSALFLRVDAALTGLAANLRDVSLWSLLPLLVDENERRDATRAGQKIGELLARPENHTIAGIMTEAAAVFGRHLACRHLFISVLVVASVVGYIIVNPFIDWLSREVVTGVIMPPVQRPVVPGHRREPPMVNDSRAAIV